MIPCEAARPAFLSALACPFLRNNKAVFSKSSPDSTRAFLASTTPAPVCSRNFLTCSKLGILSLLTRRRLRGRSRFFALDNGIRDHITDQLDGLDGVIVGRNRIIDQLRIGVGINDRNQRYVFALGLGYGDFINRYVNKKNCIGKSPNILDPANRAVQSRNFSLNVELFPLGVLLKLACRFVSLKTFEFPKEIQHRIKIGEQTTHPTPSDIRHARFFGRGFYYATCLTLGSDK